MKATIRRGKAQGVHKVIRQLHDLQDELADEAVKLYQSSAKDFSDPIVFSAEVKKDGSGRRINIYARGEGDLPGKKIDGRELYLNLDKGFQRRVRMTHDFTPKTQPGRIQSTPGTGGVLKNNRGQVVFRPPIPVEPRGFTSEIVKEIRAKWRARVREILNG